MSTTLYILTILSCIACISRLGHCLDEKAKNVIIFIADDLGYSDLSCFGNELIQTPNIDKLAKNGLKLTRMYSMPSEAGSLAAIYTGRQPMRMGLVKGNLGWPSFWSVAQSGGIPLSEMNMAKYYEMKGHVPFLFGRWGLGSWSWSLPTNQGFGGFYGTVMGHSPACSSDAEDFFADSDYFWFVLAELGPLIITFLILIISSKMLSFISIKLLIPLISMVFISIGIFRIYCWMLPLNSITCKVFDNQMVKEDFYIDTTLTSQITEKAQHYIKFRKRPPFLLIIPYHQPGHPAFASSNFLGKSGINKYYDSVLELDWSVGEVMNTLQEQGMENNTVIFFLSDSGPVLTHPYTNSHLKHSSKDMKLQGEKGSLREGGIRVPAIVSWPNFIEPNQETAVVTSVMDIFPTIQHLIGQPNKIQRTHMRHFDGKDLKQLFKNPNKKSDEIHKVLLHYCDTGDVSAATVGDYKIYFVSQNISNDCSGYILEDPLVYNIKEDPGETTALPPSQHQDVISKARSNSLRFEMSLDIKKRTIKSQFDQIPFPWDMWVSI
ncbi:steryl-sulfatase-like [Mytilus edulis]|uniref:steryl-sulfatase-like n=1 Tax=Mytilus edulis TaxID=6550 RepID=UPI0039EF5614